jgi:hypothetical protein
MIGRNCEIYIDIYIYIYLYIYRYFTIKKNEILSFAATWMELEDIMVSEIGQSQEDKSHIFSYAEAKHLISQK